MKTMRFHWLKCLFSLTLLIGMLTPAVAADNGPPDNGVELYFWICLEDHQATITPNAAQCCDGAACYTCLSDFSECWISSDTSSSAGQVSELQSERPTIRPMQERPSQGQLQNICKSVVASFKTLKGFGYACWKPNCDGKGNDCSIICHDDRQCAAQTPDVIRHAVSLRGILQNGDNIDHSSSGLSDSTESKPTDGGGGIFLY